MNAKTLSGMTAIAIAVASMSLAACDQRTPGTDSMSRSSPTSTATPSSAPSSPSTSASSSMSPSPSTANAPMSGATPSAPAGDTAAKAAAGAVDDAALMAQVKTALQSDPTLRSQSIEVDSKNATVTLTGAVDSAASKAKANEVAAGVNGVVAVVDRLTIKTS